MRTVLLILVAWAVAGCGCGKDETGNGSLKGSEQTSLAALSRAANEYGGDWSKVPPEDKELILIRFNRDEEAAIETIKSMVKNKVPVGATKTPPPEEKGAGEDPNKTNAPPGGSAGLN